MSDATPAAAQEVDSCELGTDQAGLGQADAGTRGPLDPEAVAARPEVEGELESRLAFTPAALDLINRLWELHGPLMFHQSGGCCDGSSPMCYPAGEFKIGGQDVLLGTLELRAPSHAPTLAPPREIGFWMSREQFAVWAHTHLTVDVVPGRGSGFSLEAPEGKRFLIRSRLL